MIQGQIWEGLEGRLALEGYEYLYLPAFNHNGALVLLLLKEGRLLYIRSHGCGVVKFGLLVFCFWGSRGELVQADACGG